MTAWYNEIDPYAAQWLRNLIAAGHIAPGVVDERSIADVRPEELRDFAQCHFFAGIGVWSYALRRAGWADDRPVWTGSCPCQPFSAAGKGGGFDDERHLWPHFHWLISQCRPGVVLGEQVASKDGLSWLDLVQADLEGTGYASGAVDLCAAGVGAPHIRQRLWWVGERLEHTDGAGPFAGFEGPKAARHGHSAVAGGGAVGLADTERHDGCGEHGLGLGGTSGAREGNASERERLRTDIADGGAAGGLADYPSGKFSRQLQEPGREPATRGEGMPAGGCRDLVGLEHGTSDGRIERRAEPSGRGIAGGCEPSGLADAGNGTRQRSEPRAVVGGLPEATRQDVSSGPTGPTNGLWRAADWLFCRDGKWRPVEPGTFPLAHGAPARVGRLRGYGNAINAEAAVAFIEAVMTD